MPRLAVGKRLDVPTVSLACQREKEKGPSKASRLSTKRSDWITRFSLKNERLNV